MPNTLIKLPLMPSGGGGGSGGSEEPGGGGGSSGGSGRSPGPGTACYASAQAAIASVFERMIVGGFQITPVTTASGESFLVTTGNGREWRVTGWSCVNGYVSLNIVPLYTVMRRG